jgi:hypothetical protein
MYMVNKIKRTGVHLFAPLFSVFFSLIISPLPVTAQNVSKYYKTSVQGDRILFFILPQSGFRDKDSGGDFIFDITYLTNNDSATLNFSYYSLKEFSPDSLVFHYGNQRFSGSAKRLFIETVKSKWHYRYSVRILFKDIASFFSQDTPPAIFLSSKQGAVELNIRKKAWKEQSSILRKIFTLIQYNR